MQQLLSKSLSALSEDTNISYVCFNLPSMIGDKLFLTTQDLRKTHKKDNNLHPIDAQELEILIDERLQQEEILKNKLNKTKATSKEKRPLNLKDTQEYVENFIKIMQKNTISRMNEFFINILHEVSLYFNTVKHSNVSPLIQDIEKNVVLSDLIDELASQLESNSQNERSVIETLQNILFTVSNDNWQQSFKEFSSKLVDIDQEKIKIKKFTLDKKRIDISLEKFKKNIENQILQIFSTAKKQFENDQLFWLSGYPRVQPLQKSLTEFINLHSSDVTSIHLLSNTGLVLTSSCDSTMCVFDLVHHKCQHKITLHESDIYCVDYDPGVKMIAAVSHDQSLSVWHSETFKLIHKFSKATKSYFRSVKFISNERKLIACTFDGSIQFWDLQEKWLIKEKLQAHPNAPINAIAISAAKNIIYTADAYGIVKVWDIVKGFYMNESKKCHSGIIYLNGMTITSNDNLVTCSRTDDIKVWGEEFELLEKYEFPADCVSLSNDEEQLIAGSEGKVKIFSRLKKQEVLTFNFPTDFIYCLKFAPNCSFLLAGGGNNDKKYGLYMRMLDE